MKRNNLEFKNLGSNAVDLYVYGEIVDEKWFESDVDTSEFREAFESLAEGDTLNVYINSPGGSVFTASAICSILGRVNAKGVKTVAYIDGICASAATFLAMACAEIVVYKNSMMMVHKPMAFAFGNANDMQKMIDTLDKIETDTMLPLYRSKAKVEDEAIIEMINAETWLGAEDIVAAFEARCEENEKEVAACISEEDLKKFNYKNCPQELQTKFVKREEKQEEPDPEEETPEVTDEADERPVDLSAFEERLRKVREG